jgi:integrase
MALEAIGPMEVTDKKTGETKPKGYVFPAPFRKKDQPMGDTALAVAVGRNLAYPLTDKNGKPLFNKDGKPATENRLGVEHFTPHDLRRTAATGMGGLHIMDEVIDAVLCHVKKGIIGTYNRHGYDKEKQAALEAWDRKITSIITEKKNENVISINEGHKKAA